MIYLVSVSYFVLSDIGQIKEYKGILHPSPVVINQQQAHVPVFDNTSNHLELLVAGCLYLFSDLRKRTNERERNLQSLRCLITTTVSLHQGAQDSRS